MIARLFGLVVLIVLCFNGVFVYGQLEVKGPGLNEAAPIMVTVNPPNGTTHAVFVIENTSSDDITILPMALCEPDSLKVDSFEVALNIPAGETRAIQVSLADLEGGAGVGDVVECLLVTDFFLLSFFVALTEPRDTQIGLFKLDVNLVPEGTQTEAVKMRADIEPNLQLDFTLSGLTISPDIGFGVTGLEFAILTINGFLGAIEIEDEFVFAAAFDFRDVVLANRRVSFVKKRVRTKFNLFGLTMDNLAIFENTKFRHPFSSDAQAVDAIDNPTYRFGNLLTISGRTVLNLPLTFILGMCADPFRLNIIKKRFFFGSTCDTDFLDFTVAHLRFGTLTLGDLVLTGQLDYRPHQPIRGSASARIRLLDMLNISASLLVEHNNISVRSISLSLSDLLVSASMQLRNDLSVSRTSMRLNLRFENRNTLSLAIDGDGEKTTRASASLTFNSDIGRLTASSVFTRGPADDLVLQQTSFSWSQSLNNVQMNSSMTFTSLGLRLIRVSTQFAF